MSTAWRLHPTLLFGIKRIYITLIAFPLVRNEISHCWDQPSHLHAVQRKDFLAHTFCCLGAGKQYSAGLMTNSQHGMASKHRREQPWRPQHWVWSWWPPVPRAALAPMTQWSWSIFAFPALTYLPHQPKIHVAPALPGTAWEAPLQKTTTKIQVFLYEGKILSLVCFATWHSSETIPLSACWSSGTIQCQGSELGLPHAKSLLQPAELSHNRYFYFKNNYKKIFIKILWSTMLLIMVSHARNSNTTSITVYPSLPQGPQTILSQVSVKLHYVAPFSYYAASGPLLPPCCVSLCPTMRDHSVSVPFLLADFTLHHLLELPPCYITCFSSGKILYYISAKATSQYSVLTVQ